MARLFLQLFCAIALFAVVSADKLIGVVEVCRHGARSPDSLMAWNKHNWDIEGELTPVGMRQHYLLGYQFRRRYIDNAQIISPFYNSSNIYVQSTEKTRTIRSAECQLQGLFPEGPNLLSEGQNARAFPPITIQDSASILDQLGMAALPANYASIPIHMLAEGTDFMLRTNHQCPRIDQIQDETVPNYQKYKEFEKYYNTTLAPVITALAGEKVSFDDLNHMYDNLFSNTMAGIALPQAILPYWDWMTEYHEYHVQWKFPTLEAGTLESSEFNKALVVKFDNMIAGSPQRFVFYSAHDSTLSGFLAGLSIVNNPNHVPLASTLLYELWEDASGSYYVKVIYNDEVLSIPVTPIPGMGNTYSWDNMKAFLKSRSYANITEACMAKNSTSILLESFDNEDFEPSFLA